ncbi:HNH endonuclease [Mycobacterium phage Anderson]|uniref:HNH endonuclease n=1 Tax=Mycobacterium phage Anderson TaxID=2812938 RepID=A0A899IPC1_9CAUD|nr:HNH endonuclease [Mycobacterium phage Anderson]
MRVAIPPIERFYGLTRREGACLVWTGHCVGTKSRRPRFRPTTSQHDPSVYAHRWIWDQVRGPIPEGYEIDHLCRNGLCVEITHLEPVPPSINAERTRLGVCRSGRHDLTDPRNVQWDEKGRRRGCLSCRRDRERKRQRLRRGGQ